MTTTSRKNGLSRGWTSAPRACGRPCGSSGRTVAFGVAPIETTYPRPTWAEQDPRQWWTRPRDGGRPALARRMRCAEQVAAIGLDCTACTVRGLRSGRERRCGPHCSGWISARSRRPRRSARRAIRFCATFPAGSRPSGCSQGALAQAA